MPLSQCIRHAKYHATQASQAVKLAARPLTGRSLLLASVMCLALFAICLTPPKSETVHTDWQPAAHGSQA